MKIRKTLVATLVFLMSASSLLLADEKNASVESSEVRDARMEQWREARFGMFVHWGLYSIAAGEWEGKPNKQKSAEWIQKHLNIPADVYEKKLYPKFKPKADFALEWAETAKMAGCRYLVFTSKHHEGFAMHDSKVTTFDAKDACGRDLFKEIVDATRAQGLQVGVYHSVIDWHHPHAYAGFGLPTIKGVTNQGRDNSIYVDYLHNQVKEIVTGYGPIDILWWDFSKPDCQGESWRASELVAMVRKHQPHVLMNDRLYASSSFMTTDASLLKSWKPERGDFTTPEQHVPDMGVEGVDWETCMTMNNTWGYSEHDSNWKSTKVLLHNLIDIVSKGGNYLLNIGPMPDGTVPPASIQRMKEIGQWMNVNGEAIYATTASPYDQPKWGRYTTKPGRLYAHVLQWPEDSKLRIDTNDLDVTKAYLLADKTQKTLSIERTKAGLVLSLPAEATDSVASVIVLEYDRNKN
ncbi:alpha-L-fucosidase [Neorhodopirellula lusitana]|uniref:alpha-L-fucosidase n=1 Tax=Neorhodopirellula lusitana TaxID=445327 RepID=UPI00384F5320